MLNKNSNNILPIEIIERKIYLIRGMKVMLDSDLAELYGVPTKRLNEAVKRNVERFPADFMLQLNKTEAENLRPQITSRGSRSQFATLNRSQFATGSQKHRDPRLFPYAFTEHGVAMLSSVLKSKQAVRMNILIIRAFVKLRELLAGQRELIKWIRRIEKDQKRHSSVIAFLAEEINKLKAPLLKPKDAIGFQVK